MNGLFIKKYPKEFEELYMKVFNTNKQDSVELISTFVNLINNQISYVRKTSISEFKNDYIDSYFGYISFFWLLICLLIILY